MDTQIDKRRFSPRVITLIALLVIAGISLLIRLVLPYDQVFVHGSVWFQETDAHYFMRHIENAVHNFPHINSFDPYVLYPGGGSGPGRPFFVWLVAGIAWLAGLGSPTQHTIYVVGAYVPPILGTLTIITVYFIGKELFNRWVGLLSAALLAILPGEFLYRSLLGVTDHHVAISLLFTAAMLFFILAIKRARERQISFTHLLHRDWSTIAKPLIYASLAGIFLGSHFLSWRGALLLVFVLSVYLVIQFIIDHLKGKSTDYLCITGSLCFLIAFIVYLLYFGKGEASSMYGASLVIATLTPIALSIISRLMARKAVKPIYYVPILVGIAAISLAVFHGLNPSLLDSMLSMFGRFMPGGLSFTILETQPLLFLPDGRFTLQRAWFDFTTSFFISFISLGLLIYASIRRESPDRTLLLVWSVTTLVAALGQRRFGDYFAINAALLTAYFAGRILDFAGLRELLAKPKETVKVVEKVKKRKETQLKARKNVLRQRRATWAKVTIAGVAIFFLVFLPNIGKAQALATGSSQIDQAWYSTLTWLRDNSPEPFGDPNFYYELYETPFQYPETVYGVMSWWDYGYWIMHISHRIPNTNPSQEHAGQAARFFLVQKESWANKIMNRMISKYVVIDHRMPTTKFDVMAIWADKAPEDFYETYYLPKEGGKLQPVVLFYPSYYNSTVVRLYNFDGKAVNPEQTVVISYEEKMSKEGIRYKKITDRKLFSSYEEAQAFVSSQELGNYILVGTDRFTSPVPLAKLEHYKLVYASPQKWRDKPSVKVFEYTR